MNTSDNNQDDMNRLEPEKVKIPSGKFLDSWGATTIDEHDEYKEVTSFVSIGVVDANKKISRVLVSVEENLVKCEDKIVNMKRIIVNKAEAEENGFIIEFK